MNHRMKMQHIAINERKGEVGLESKSLARCSSQGEGNKDGREKVNLKNKKINKEEAERARVL